MFLQEVIPETFSYIESKMTNYDCIAAKQSEYFVATLLRRGRVYMDRHKVVDFPTTRMYRHVLAYNIFSIRDVAQLIRAVKTLDLSTRLSLECCVKMTEVFPSGSPVTQLASLMARCNRSEPHKEVT